MKCLSHGFSVQFLLACVLYVRRGWMCDYLCECGYAFWRSVIMLGTLLHLWYGSIAILWPRLEDYPEARPGNSVVFIENAKGKFGWLAMAMAIAEARAMSMAMAWQGPLQWLRS